MRAIGTLLAAETDQFEVLALSPSVGIDPHMTLPRLLLAARGFRVDTDARGAVGRGRPVMNYRDAMLRCTVLDTPCRPGQEWEFLFGDQFNRLYENLLESFEPDIVFCCGGRPGDVLRRELARLSGARVVLAVHSLDSRHRLAFEQVDDVLLPSVYLRDQYASAIGLRAPAIPIPIGPIGPPPAAADVPPRLATSLLYRRPSPGRGVTFMLAVARDLLRRRVPAAITITDIGNGLPLLRELEQMHMGRVGALTNIRIAGQAESFESCAARATIGLVPSTVYEGTGLDAAEMAAAGVLPIVSDRGALPEAVGGSFAPESAGGLILNLPQVLTDQSLDMPTPADTRPWVDAIEQLTQDHAFHAAARSRMVTLAHSREPAALAPAYVNYFSDISRRRQLFGPEETISR